MLILLYLRVERDKVKVQTGKRSFKENIHTLTSGHTYLRCYSRSEFFDNKKFYLRPISDHLGKTPFCLKTRKDVFPQVSSQWMKPGNYLNLHQEQNEESVVYSYSRIRHSNENKWIKLHATISQKHNIEQEARHKRIHVVWDSFHKKQTQSLLAVRRELKGLGGSGWRLGTSGCYYMALFICINSSSCTIMTWTLCCITYDKILSLKYVILSMPNRLCVNFFWTNQRKLMTEIISDNRVWKCLSNIQKWRTGFNLLLVIRKLYYTLCFWMWLKNYMHHPIGKQNFIYQKRRPYYLWIKGFSH